MSSNKMSSVVALHIFMSKLHGEPKYECLNKFGKSHKPYFRYSCKAMGEEVFGTGRSKRDAKNVVARMMLEQLSLRGYTVPPEFASPDAIAEIMQRAGMPTHSFVVLLNELSNQYHLDPVEYDVVLQGSSAQPNFMVKVRIGHVQRVATASSKRMAAQLAAEQLYKHLRKQLRGVGNFNENEAIIRAYERALAPTDEDLAAEERRREEQQLDEARALTDKEKNKKGSAVQESVRLELGHSDSPSFEDGPGPATTSAAQQDADERAAAAAMSFLERTMERLGL